MFCSWNVRCLFCIFQACKVEELGVVDYEEEIKKRTQMVYVPNWFSVDIKTGVSTATSVIESMPCGLRMERGWGWGEGGWVSLVVALVRLFQSISIKLNLEWFYLAREIVTTLLVSIMH